MPVAGGEEEEVVVFENNPFWTVLQPVRNGIYYAELDRPPRAMEVSYFDFERKRSTVAFRLPIRNIGQATSYSVSPDGKHFLYPRVDQSETNLMMVENFR
jgi:hypothetical protein